MEAIIVCVVILGAAILFKSMYQSSQIASGKLRRRPPDFTHYTSFFTLKNIPDEELVKAIKNLDTKVKIKGNVEEVLFECGSYFKAALTRLERDADKMVYSFAFTSWEEYANGRSDFDMEMNRLLTTIEKLFLELDPETRISTQKNVVR